jgi:hypothetical protein
MEKSLTNSNTDLILSIIKADMRNYKLILGLDNAGVLAEDFFTDLGRSVMVLMDFEEEDRDDGLYELYDKFMDRLVEINVHQFHDAIKTLSIELYADLLAEKKVRERGRVMGPE